MLYEVCGRIPRQFVNPERVFRQLESSSSQVSPHRRRKSQIIVQLLKRETGNDLLTQQNGFCKKKEKNFEGDLRMR